MAAGDAAAYAYENVGLANPSPIPAIGYGYENIGVAPRSDYASRALRFGPIWFFRNENPVTNVNSAPTSAASALSNYGNSTDVVGLYPNAVSPGRARSWPGTGGISLNSVPANGSDSYTLGAAVKVVGGTGDQMSVASVVGPIAAGHSCINGFDPTGRPYLHCYGGGIEIQLTGPTTLIDATAHYVVWRYDKVTFAVDIFVDGTKVVSGNNLGPIRSGSNLREFASANGRVFKGIIDEAIWVPRALTDAEVGELSDTWAAGVLLTDAFFGYENVVDEVLFRWWDGSATHPARLKGWWDATSGTVKPVAARGYTEGGVIKPVK